MTTRKQPMSLRDDDHVSVRRWLAGIEKKSLGGGLPFAGSGGGGGGLPIWWGDGRLTGAIGNLLPGARADYAAKAGQLHKNAVVASCLGWIVDNLVQARPVVQRVDDSGNVAPVSDHPLVALLRRPNEYYPARALWGATAIAYKLTGDAYWYKIPAGGPNGPTVGLRWLSPWSTYPTRAIGSGPTNTYIDTYTYRVGQREFLIPKDRIVHFRDTLALEDERTGWRRSEAVLREICSTNEGSTYIAAILSRMGVVPYVFTGKDGTPLDDAEGLKLVDWFHDAGGGDDRGSSLPLRLPVEVHQLGLSPQDMALESILDRPIAFICSLFRLDPLVLGIESDRGTYQNVGQARQAAWEDCLMPLLAAFADDIQHQLMPEFGDASSVEFAWDFSSVRALREGEDAKNNRAIAGWTSGLVFFNDARKQVGEKPVEGGDELLLLGGRILRFGEILDGVCDAENVEGDDDPDAESDSACEETPEGEPDAENDEQLGGEADLEPNREGKTLEIKSPRRRRKQRRRGTIPSRLGRRPFDESLHPRDHGKFATKPGAKRRRRLNRKDKRRIASARLADHAERRVGAISGEFPSVKWRPNPNGETRTIEEAVEIARRNGVRIPKDAEFFIDDRNELDHRTTARGPEVSASSGERVAWSDLVHPLTGKVPFRIRPDILKSDEAIVAVIAHESHELRECKKMMRKRGAISIEEFIANHASDNFGNFHQQAWDVADALVRRMRGENR
jgi:HK97 family phage portal protein